MQRFTHVTVNADAKTSDFFKIEERARHDMNNYGSLIPARI
jgi:hypothetical protein